MNLSVGLLPDLVLWSAHPIYGALLGYAVLRAPWARLERSENLHVFLGSAVALLLVWSLKAGINPGLDFHLLGGTLFTLMFGWELALVGVSLVMLGFTAFSGADWMSFSLNILLMGALPVLVTQGMLWLALRYLPHHFFIYVIVNAYLCGGLAMGLTVVVGSTLLVLSGTYSFAKIANAYLPFAPFMIFAEGFFSGMLAAGMALMRPEWITTFDDRRYLVGK